MAWGGARSAHKSGWCRASLPKASPAGRSTAASHSSREQCRLLACDSPFEHDCSVHYHGRHCTDAVSFAFLTHLLRRAASFNYFASTRGNGVFHQSQRIVAERATRGENFDLSFTCHSNSPPFIRLCRLHSRAATLVERIAREFAEEFSVLLCFAAARLHLFAGESADQLRRSSRCHSCHRYCCQQRQPFCNSFHQFTSFNCLTSSLYTLEPSPRSTAYFRNFAATISPAESLRQKPGNHDDEKHHQQNTDEPPDKHSAMHHLHIS